MLNNLKTPNVISLWKTDFVTEFSPVEKVFIDLLQDSIRFLINKDLKLVIVEDRSRVPKKVAKNFFVINKSDFDRTLSKSSSQDYTMLLFVTRSFSANIANEYCNI